MASRFEAAAAPILYVQYCHCAANLIISQACFLTVALEPFINRFIALDRNRPQCSLMGFNLPIMILRPNKSNA